MAEALLAHIRRVLISGSGRAAAGPDPAELLLREAELELELAEQAVREARSEAHGRRLRAGRSRATVIARLADLDSHAQLALDRDLEEVARDVQARQAALEQELELLAAEQADAETKARSADTTLVELQSRRQALVSERAERPQGGHSGEDRSRRLQSIWRADRMIARALAAHRTKTGPVQPWSSATKL